MSTQICRIVLWIFGIAYLAALALFAIGVFGLFGQERDPLSAVFLLPLGMPWILYLARFADDVRPWLTAAAPLVNLISLIVLCHLFKARRGDGI